MSEFSKPDFSYGKLDYELTTGKCVSTEPLKGYALWLTCA